MQLFMRVNRHTRCSVFEDIIPKWQQNVKNYVLTYYDGEKIGDRSINRCTELTETLCPESFKLGTPTAGSENDCSGSHFILHEEILGAAAAGGMTDLPVVDERALLETEPSLLSKSQAGDTCSTSHVAQAMVVRHTSFECYIASSNS